MSKESDLEFTEETVRARVRRETYDIYRYGSDLLAMGIPKMLENSIRLCRNFLPAYCGRHLFTSGRCRTCEAEAGSVRRLLSSLDVTQEAGGHVITLSFTNDDPVLHSVPIEYQSSIADVAETLRRFADSLDGTLWAEDYDQDEDS